ncbi:MAG: amidohydrolase family protein [Bryobacteraceae bacterium]
MSVDVNVNLGRWPFRRVPGDESTAVLAARLRKRGVEQAWAAHFDGLLHTDLGAVNARLAEECRAHPPFVPFGSVNPTLPDWQEDLRRCHEVHRMPGIRLHPNYQGYPLSSPLAEEVLAAAEKRRLIVQVALSMEDERTQHPLVRAPQTDAAPLQQLVARHPKLRLVVLNMNKALPPEMVKGLAAAGVCFDISMVESATGVARFASVAGIERVLFGSHQPLYYWESASLKLKESGFSVEDAKKITFDNPRRVLSA